MRKDFGKKTWMYPMPVLIIGTYDESGAPDAMNAAWGGIYDTDQIMICLEHSHKTTKNIRAKGEFTVSFADAGHVSQADYLGLVSGNDVPDKLERAGLHCTRAGNVDAPMIDEFPLTLECRLKKFNEDGIVVADIVNVSADESVLDAGGEIDPGKLRALIFEPAHNGYHVMGERVGNAFADGTEIG